MKYLLYIFVGLFFCRATVLSQPAERRITRAEYIEKYKGDAIQEMHRSGVPASITLAQGILESGDGNSPLALYAKNHFGIKCHAGWDGGTFILDDDKKDECFRKYKSVYQSYKDHSDFLTTRSRYDGLFDLKITDYKGWAKGLKKAGYATNPKYAVQLIFLIEKNNLSQYDSHVETLPKKHVKNRSSKVLASVKTTRLIKLHNNIKFVTVKKGDTFYKIAHDFELGLWQIYKYNDLNKTDVLHVGDIIYLQPKRSKAAEEFHVMAKGDTMRKISQTYGVKLKHLYKKNQMILGTEPSVGTKIYLRDKKT